MNPCWLCGSNTQTLERIHTPCLYAYLFPRIIRIGDEIVPRTV